MQVKQDSTVEPARVCPHCHNGEYLLVKGSVPMPSFHGDWGAVLRHGSQHRSILVGTQVRCMFWALTYAAAVVGATSRTWFELFWIPLIPFKKHIIWKCGVCRKSRAGCASDVEC